jgi:hypothetical protein
METTLDLPETKEEWLKKRRFYLDNLHDPERVDGGEKLGYLTTEELDSCKIMREDDSWSDDDSWWMEEYESYRENLFVNPEQEITPEWVWEVMDTCSDCLYAEGKLLSLDRLGFIVPELPHINPETREFWDSGEETEKYYHAIMEDFSELLKRENWRLYCDYFQDWSDA